MKDLVWGLFNPYDMALRSCPVIVLEANDSH